MLPGVTPRGWGEGCVVVEGVFLCRLSILWVGLLGCEGLLLRLVDVVFGHLEKPIGLAAQSAWGKGLLTLGCCNLLGCRDISVELAAAHHGE